MRVQVEDNMCPDSIDDNMALWDTVQACIWDIEYADKQPAL